MRAGERIGGRRASGRFRRRWWGGATAEAGQEEDLRGEGGAESRSWWGVQESPLVTNGGVQTHALHTETPGCGAVLFCKMLPVTADEPAGRLCTTCLQLPANLVSLFQHKRVLVNASRHCSVPGGLTQARQGVSGRAHSSGRPEVPVTALQGP